MKLSHIIISIFMLNLLIACSPVDSMRPFAGAQARSFVLANYVAQPSKQPPATAAMH